MEGISNIPLRNDEDLNWGRGGERKIKRKKEKEGEGGEGERYIMYFGSRINRSS